MITVTEGDIFESKCQTLVNPVNCVGVMGAGLALAFKQRFPAMFLDYQDRCKRHQVRLGEPYLFSHGSGTLILNFPTKDHWKDDSYLSDIMSGLESLRSMIFYDPKIYSVAMPALGCGLGGLSWSDVGPMMLGTLRHVRIPIEIYLPA